MFFWEGTKRGGLKKANIAHCGVMVMLLFVEYFDIHFSPAVHFFFGTQQNASDYGELNLISGNSGTLHLSYNAYGTVSDAFSSDGRHVKYQYDKYGDLIEVTLSDQSVTTYQYQHAKKIEDGSSTSTTVYSTHLLTQEVKANGRILKNNYDDQCRVVAQYSTVGISPVPTQSATFAYSVTATNDDHTANGSTSVTDAKERGRERGRSHNSLNLVPVH